MPEAPEPPPPSSPEDIFPYERAPRVPTRRDASAMYELRSRSDRDRSSRVTNVSQPTNNYGEPPHYSLLVPEAHTTSLKRLNCLHCRWQSLHELGELAQERSYFDTSTK